MNTPTFFKVWLICGFISAIWYVSELPDTDEKDEEFLLCSWTMLKALCIWPYMVYKSLNPESKTPIVP